MFNLYTAICVNQINTNLLMSMLQADSLQQILDLKQAIVNLEISIQCVPKTWVIHFEWQNKKLLTGSC